MSAAELYAHSLSSTCVAHLDEESTALGALNQCLVEIGDALRNHDTAELKRLVEIQQIRMKRFSSLRERRGQVRKLIAENGGSNVNEVSILDWAMTLPEPERTAVLEQRNRLVQLAEESQRLSSKNMAAVNSGLLILQDVLESLTGQESVSDRYTANGNIRSLSVQQPNPNGRE